MEDREILPPSNLVLDLVAAIDCSAYDYEYVALARHFSVKLVTGDHKILRNFPETAVELVAFSGFLQKYLSWPKLDLPSN